jgi:hypothetical protein
MQTSFLTLKRTVLITTALALLPPGQACAHTGPLPKLHVLAVGINNPAGMDPSYNLPAAAKNAQDEVTFWKNQQGRIYQGVIAPPPLINEQATRQAILAGLDQMVHAARQGDMAIVALCGHGCFLRRGQWALVAYDGPVFSSDLRARIERLAQKGVRVLLIVDSCHSGGIGIGGENIIVMAACAADELAQYSWDSTDNSVFTKALLEGLSGAADGNGDGIVTLAELDAYVAARVEQLNRRQCPTCGRGANIRSNLPLAMTSGPGGDSGPATGPRRGSGTGPIPHLLSGSSKATVPTTSCGWRAPVRPRCNLSGLAGRP